MWWCRICRRRPKGGGQGQAGAVETEGGRSSTIVLWVESSSPPSEAQADPMVGVRVLDGVGDEIKPRGCLPHADVI
jgi:hypothetical protein